MINKSSKHHSRSQSYRAEPSKENLGDGTLNSTAAGSFLNSIITGNSSHYNTLSFRKLEKDPTKKSASVFAIKNTRSQSTKKYRQQPSNTETREQNLSKIISLKEFDKDYNMRKQRDEIERKKSVIYKQYSTRIINLGKTRNILDENDIANEAIDRREMRKRIRMRIRSGINIEEHERASQGCNKFFESTILNMIKNPTNIRENSYIKPISEVKRDILYLQYKEEKFKIIKNQIQSLQNRYREDLPNHMDPMDLEFEIKTKNYNHLEIKAVREIKKFEEDKQTITNEILRTVRFKKKKEMSEVIKDNREQISSGKLSKQEVLEKKKEIILSIQEKLVDIMSKYPDIFKISKYLYHRKRGAKSSNDDYIAYLEENQTFGKRELMSKAKKVIY